MSAELCSGDTRFNMAIDGCHLADEDGDCKHSTTWTGIKTTPTGDMRLDDALIVAAMYGGTWDDDVEELGMAMALETLAAEVRRLSRIVNGVAA